MTINNSTGSIINQVYGTTQSVPIIGKGATILYHSDRRVYEVVEVSADKKKAIIRQYVPKLIEGSAADEFQVYKYEELLPYREKIVFMDGSWRLAIREVQLTKKYFEEYETSTEKNKWKEMIYPLIDPETNTLMLVKGKTYLTFRYPKINIIFGVKNGYHDPTF